MGQTLPRVWHACKRGGRGKKIFCLLLFADNNTLCRELIIFANLEDLHGNIGVSNCIVAALLQQTEKLAILET